MKLKLKTKYWTVLSNLESCSIIDPILGKDWDLKIHEYQNPIYESEPFSTGFTWIIPIIHWITEETEILYMIVKYPDIFEVYDENYVNT